MSLIQIAGEDLEFLPVDTKIVEPLSGELIAKLAGADDPKQYIIIEWLEDGNLETLRLDETAIFKPDKTHRFIVFFGATTYSFEIDERRLEWGASKIRGDVLKKLAGVNPLEYGVWQENSSSDDNKIENDEFAELDKSGLEIFFTARVESTEGT